jgi:hypothetical protein
MSVARALTLNCFCGRTYSNETDLEEHREGPWALPLA